MNWSDTALEFQSRELIGAKPFGRAEIVAQSSFDTGSINVSHISLEIVD